MGHNNVPGGCFYKASRFVVELGFFIGLLSSGFWVPAFELPSGIVEPSHHADAYWSTGALSVHSYQEAQAQGTWLASCAEASENKSSYVTESCGLRLDQTLDQAKASRDSSACRAPFSDLALPFQHGRILAVHELRAVVQALSELLSALPQALDGLDGTTGTAAVVTKWSSSTVDGKLCGDARVRMDEPEDEVSGTTAIERSTAQGWWSWKRQRQGQRQAEGQRQRQRQAYARHRGAGASFAAFLGYFACPSHFCWSAIAKVTACTAGCTVGGDEVAPSPGTASRPTGRSAHCIKGAVGRLFRYDAQAGGQGPAQPGQPPKQGEGGSRADPSRQGWVRGHLGGLHHPTARIALEAVPTALGSSERICRGRSSLGCHAQRDGWSFAKSWREICGVGPSDQLGKRHGGRPEVRPCRGAQGECGGDRVRPEAAPRGSGSDASHGAAWSAARWFENTASADRQWKCFISGSVDWQPGQGAKSDRSCQGLSSHAVIGWGSSQLRREREVQSALAFWQAPDVSPQVSPGAPHMCHAYGAWYPRQRPVMLEPDYVQPLFAELLGLCMSVAACSDEAFLSACNDPRIQPDREDVHRSIQASANTEEPAGCNGTGATGRMDNLTRVDPSLLQSPVVPGICPGLGCSEFNVHSLRRGEGLCSEECTKLRSCLKRPSTCIRARGSLKVTFGFAVSF